MRSPHTLLTSTKTAAGKRQRGIGESLHVFFVCTMIAPTVVCGCSYLEAGLRAGSLSREANDFFNQGKYEASLSKYEQILEKHPAAADRVLFEMGIIYAYPKTSKETIRNLWNAFRSSYGITPIVTTGGTAR